MTAHIYTPVGFMDTASYRIARVIGGEIHRAHLVTLSPTWLTYTPAFVTCLPERTP